MVPVQLRFETGLTSEQYVTEQAWLKARLDRCPTVHRLFSREGLFDKKPPDGEDRRRFAFQNAGELWMSDVMHGPKVRDGRSRRKTYLIAFIDDAKVVVSMKTSDRSVKRSRRRSNRRSSISSLKLSPPSTTLAWVKPDQGRRKW